MSDFAEKVIAVVERHRAVSAVRLAGSRSGDTAVELSDWDFAVEVTDFGAAREALPALVSPLRPLARQWDRLAEHPAYMLMLRGPVKVDFLFLGQAHEGRRRPGRSPARASERSTIIFGIGFCGSPRSIRREDRCS